MDSATIFTSLRVMSFLNVITHESLVYSLILFQSTPLLVMCIAYSVIWKKRKSPMGNRAQLAREAKLARTLILIITASLLTWLPFQIIQVLLLF